MTKKRKHISGKFKYLIMSDKGMTLIEVLLGLMILGVMAVLMGGVFVNSLGMISRAGDLDSTGYTAAKVTENALDGQDLIVSGSNILIKDEVVENTALPLDSEKTITINFPAANIDVAGNQKKIEATGYLNDVTIEVFIPHED